MSDDDLYELLQELKYSRGHVFGVADVLEKLIKGLAQDARRKEANKCEED